MIGIFFIKYCLKECVSTKLWVTVNHVLVSLASSFSLSIYIYMHPFTKTLLLQKYISYICMNAEKRLKQDGHTLHQPHGVPITCNFFFDMRTCLFWCWQKRYRRRKGIVIYMMYMFLNSNVFENGCVYIYMYIYIYIIYSSI